MNLIKTCICILFALCSVSIVSSQELTPKQKEREANKTKLYTPEEEDRLQLWFYEETKKFELSEEDFDRYRSIIADNLYDMRRLNDKDKGLSNDEVVAELKKLVTKTNLEVKDMLSAEQYKRHEELMQKLAESAIKKQMKQ